MKTFKIPMAILVVMALIVSTGAGLFAQQTEDKEENKNVVKSVRIVKEGSDVHQKGIIEEIDGETIEIIMEIDEEEGSGHTNMTIDVDGKAVNLHEYIEGMTSEQSGNYRLDTTINLDGKKLHVIKIKNTEVIDGKEEVTVEQIHEWIMEGEEGNGDIRIKMDHEEHGHHGEMHKRVIIKHTDVEDLEEVLEEMDIELDIIVDGDEHHVKGEKVIIIKMCHIALVEEDDEIVHKVREEHSLSDNKTLDLKDLSFYPNPNTGQFTLDFNIGTRGKTMIRIFDLQGKEIFKEDLGRFKGRYVKQLDISGHREGTYLMEIEQNGKALVRKLLIQ